MIDPASSLPQNPSSPAVSTYAQQGTDIAKNVSFSVFPVANGLDLQPQPPQTSIGQQGRIHLTGLNLCQPCADIAAQGRHDEGLGAMRRAYAADDGNTVIRAILADALAARARTLIDTDWAAADRLSPASRSASTRPSTNPVR